MSIQTNENGQLLFYAIVNNEPSGKPLSECQRIKVALTLIAPEDNSINTTKGLAFLRQHRIQRLTCEASAAGAVLTYEDLANILTSSVSTIFRDIGQLRRQGEFIPTRGQVKDIGRNINNKLQMVQLFYGEKLDYEEIARRFHRTSPEVQKQLQRFQEVIVLLNRRMPLPNIVKITGLANSLVQKYVALAAEFKLLNKLSESEISEPVNEAK